MHYFCEVVEVTHQAEVVYVNRGGTPTNYK